MSKIKKLITKKELTKKIEEIAKKIDKDYEKKQITTICVMRGACYFFTQLSLAMETPIKTEFIEISSYGQNTTTSQNIVLRTDIRDNIEGQDVLIIEDIVDTGLSMNYLIEHIKAKNPKSIKVCVLASKMEKRKVPVKIDYLGFQIPDKFVVGFGFDVGDLYRNLPYVGYIEE